MNTITKEERNYGLELFRFLSMFMVVILHILGHGSVLSALSGTRLYAVYFLKVLCVIAVNCFALITGYLNYNKRFSFKRLLNLWLQVFFINAVTSIIFIVFDLEKFTFETLLDIIFPILRREYWYFTAYFMVVVLMPVLNVVIEKTKKSVILITLTFIGLFIGFLTFNANYFHLFDFSNGFSVTWLVFLYLCGGVIHKYNLRILIFDKRNYCYLLLYVALSILALVFSVNSLINHESPAIEMYTNIFNLINSILLLLYFSNLNLNKNKFISYLSTTSFGVYLIHEQPMIRAHLIKNQFIIFSNYNIVIIYLLVLLSAFIIYLLCSIIEYTRLKLFKLSRINKLADFVDIKIKQNFENITNFIDNTAGETDQSENS